MNTKRKKSDPRPDRLEYLYLLIEEFQKTKSKDAKQQVLANLANFAYDPFNYKYIRQLGILDVFLSNLASADETIIQFSIGGLCNLSLDPQNKTYILENNGVREIKRLLEFQNVEILISAVTTLMYLVVPESKAEITGADVLRRMIIFTQSQDRRLKNLAEIFLQDYCTEEQVEKASSHSGNVVVEDIPLPDSS